MTIRKHLASLSLGLSFVSQIALASSAAQGITILHTNDLHSHFRPEKTPLALGGVARLKTAVENIRKQTPHTVFVDGGDWSEGSIYYTLGAGVESLRMMDHLGYDVAVLGNHDWLNGPDIILNNLKHVSPSTSLVAANLLLDHYDRAQEFRQKILPFVLKKVGELTVAFIGIATYEFIYDRYLAPVKVTEPFTLTRQLAAQLRKKADLIVGVSHNNLKINETILNAAPELDVIIGAHDHTKLTHPIRVQRSNGRTGWLVEAGCWGRYLGRLDLRVERGASPKVELAQYRLLQLDRTTPENPETLQIIDRLERELEQAHGPLYHDHLGENHTELSRGMLENRMGNFTTDAYRHFTQADIGVDATKFIYGELHEGPVRAADMMDINPAIFSPKERHTWTLKLLPMKGKSLAWMLNTLLLSKNVQKFELLSLSGMEVIFDPVFAQTFSLPLSQNTLVPGEFENFQSQFLDLSPLLHRVMIQGKPLDMDATYRVAAGGGILEVFTFLNSVIPKSVPLEGLRDTGVENWRVMADYFRRMAPLTPEKVTRGDRLITKQADLGITYDDINWQPIGESPFGMKAKVFVRVSNSGATRYDGRSAKLRLMTNLNGIDLSKDPALQPLVPARGIGALGPGESQVYEFEATVPKFDGIYPLHVEIEGAAKEANISNESVIRYFMH